MRIERETQSDTDQACQVPSPLNDSVLESSTRRVSLWKLLCLPIAVGLGLSFCISFIQWLREENTRLLFVGLDGMRFPLLMGLVGVLLSIGVLFFFRPRFRTVLTVILPLLLIGYVVRQCVRIDSYNGDRTPRWTWRWNPSAEEKVKSYFTSSRPRPQATTTPTDWYRESATSFPGFLGPGRDARIDGPDLVENWQSHPPQLLWRHPVGLGWSSFAVAGNAAVTLEQRDEEECIVCYDLGRGHEVWCHREPVRFKNEHGDGPRTTPTIHGGRVFTPGATGVVSCLELTTGELIWKRDVFENSNQENLFFGMSGSPLVYDNLVVVTPGTNPSAIAYSIDTGDTVWRHEGDPGAYASPLTAQIGGIRQLLSFNGAGLRGYSLEGDPLWLHPWLTQGESRVNVAQPWVLSSADQVADRSNTARVLISSGYDVGSALLQVTQDEGEWKTDVIWTSKALKSKFSNFVVVGDYVYGFDNGLMTCISLADGRRSWKKGRYGHGQMLLVRDKLLIQAESGEVILVHPHPDGLRELTRFEALDSKTWNHPALAGNILVVRNNQEAAAYELPTY